MSATDTQSLRDLAAGWRLVSRRCLNNNRTLQDDDPGPHITAIQLEWAANEIDLLRVVPCGCKTTCGDDGDNEGPGTCKRLPRAPEPPLVEVVLKHRNDPA